MSSTFGILETAKSGLSAAMQNLNITGHNIANANTEGYTRQRLTTSAVDPSNSSYLVAQVDTADVGSGVEVLGVQQIRSSYLDDQYRALNAGYNYSEYRTQSLAYLEGLFDETDDESGLTTAIENFYSALNTLTEDASSEEYRTNVQQQALALTESFNIVYEEMNDLWADQNDAIAANADGINSLAEQISEMNKAIAQYERTGETANDLRDELNLLLDELSGVVNMTYSVNTNNSSMVDIQIGGLSLVNGTTVNEIEADSASNHITEIDALTTQIASINDDIALSGTGTATAAQLADIQAYLTDLSQYIDISSSSDATTGITDVTFNGVSLVSGSDFTSIEDAAATDLTAWVGLYRNNLALDGGELSIDAGTVTSGELYAHIEMIEGSEAGVAGIPYYMSQLNELAQTIAQNVNTIHSKGYTYPQDGASSVTDINFFDVDMIPDGSGGYSGDYSKITAGNLSLSDEVLESVYNIAAAGAEVDLSAASTETGDNTIASELLEDLDDSGYYGMLNSIVGHLATTKYSSTSILDTKESLLESIDTQRESVAGVSTDEETTNLIIYQQTYTACARVITAIDEMIETLVSSTGLVGR
ncbi:MAG: flagellar hook-associated protein FlgK [Clostridia bacterium]|nr:flagellar hook-associated protein FlgK [Clostridia bacterium]